MAADKFNVKFRTTLGDYPHYSGLWFDSLDKARDAAREGLWGSQQWMLPPYQFAQVTYPDGQTESIEYGRS